MSCSERDLGSIVRYRMGWLRGSLLDHRILMQSSAELSQCKRYRYALRRVWDPKGKVVLFVLLNPSTANARRDDPTLRRCIGFAKSWGFGGLSIGNLFAYRATDPKRLLSARNPIGPQNDAWLKLLAGEAHLVVAGWGEHGKLLARDREVVALIGRPKVLATTVSGRPRHPLYLRRELVPRAWRG
ncbi:MAG: DUF1643 domain-containing protein [Gemmatimonadaceae bacterium]